MCTRINEFEFDNSTVLVIQSLSNIKSEALTPTTGLTLKTPKCWHSKHPDFKVSPGRICKQFSLWAPTTASRVRATNKGLCQRFKSTPESRVGERVGCRVQAHRCWHTLQAGVRAWGDCSAFQVPTLVVGQSCCPFWRRLGGVENVTPGKRHVSH